MCRMREGLRQQYGVLHIKKVNWILGCHDEFGKSFVVRSEVRSTSEKLVP